MVHLEEVEPDGLMEQQQAGISPVMHLHRNGGLSGDTGNGELAKEMGRGSSAAPKASISVSKKTWQECRVVSMCLKPA